MTFRRRFLGRPSRWALAPALPLCTLLSACSNSNGIPQTFDDVFLGAYYDPNHIMQNTCASFKSLKEVFSIGTATGNCNAQTNVCNGTGPVRVADGASQSGGATVNVKCSVTGSYDLSLNASLGSTGTLQINGHVDGKSGGTMLSGDIAYEGNDYTASGNCSAAFTYGGDPVPQNPPIASGRVWAHLSCPQMVDPQGLRHIILMDGTQVPEVCDGEVDFIFENCSM
jgi:hypothetical protein